MTVDLDLAAYEATNAARVLDELEIELNPATEQLLRWLTDLRQNQPPQPAHNAVAILIADNADPATIDAAIATNVGQAHRVQQHALAANILGQRVLDALLADSERIHAELAVTAEATIERLHRAAAIDETITELTKQRRTEDAHILACIDSDAEQLRSLFYVRDAYLTSPDARWSTGWWNCKQLKNPWDVGHPQPADDTVWGVWRAQIRAGGRLWYPTVDQARAASQAREPADTLPPINPYRETNAVFK